MSATARWAATAREKNDMSEEKTENRDRDNFPYEDIINMPHHVSKRHPPLGKDSYAAQFSPFAALTGYDGVVNEAARTTESLIELDEEAKERISRVLGEALVRADAVVRVTYFLPDEKKDGGRYETVSGTVAKYDRIGNVITLGGGQRVPVERITDARSDSIQD